MVSAIPTLTTKKAVDLFGKFGVFTAAELESRSEIMYETFAKVTFIEARTMVHMAAKHYIPAVIRNCTRLGDSICKVRAACPQASVSVQEKLLEKTSALLTQASAAMEALRDAAEQGNRMEGIREVANYCYDVVVPAMKALRDPIDRLELIVDKDLWPVPTYGDLVFEV